MIHSYPVWIILLAVFWPTIGSPLSLLGALDRTIAMETDSTAGPFRDLALVEDQWSGKRVWCWKLGVEGKEGMGKRNEINKKNREGKEAGGGNSKKFWCEQVNAAVQAAPKEKPLRDKGRPGWMCCWELVFTQSTDHICRWSMDDPSMNKDYFRTSAFWSHR